MDDGLVTTDEWIRGGLVYDIASTTGGALVTASHRYFGNNMPTPLVPYYINETKLRNLTIACEIISEPQLSKTWHI